METPPIIDRLPTSCPQTDNGLCMDSRLFMDCPRTPQRLSTDCPQTKVSQYATHGNLVVGLRFVEIQNLQGSLYAELEEEMTFKIRKYKGVSQ